MRKKIAIIGSGFSGLSSAAYAALAGNEVEVFEKNDTAGGRARQLITDNGYRFDMGPSWYWMPDIIENFFRDFGTKTSDYFELVGLNPQFEMLFSHSKVQVPEDYEGLRNLFESIETGAAEKLDLFMQSAAHKYRVGMQEFAHKPCHSWTEFLSLNLVKTAVNLDLLTNYRSYVKKYFSDPRLIALMEFPVIFLGASPKNIPALYSLMNYGGYVLGTKYPMGGIHSLVTAMKSIAEKQGAQFYFNRNVEKIIVQNSRVTSLVVNGRTMHFDGVIASSDYHHTESLLDKPYRNYKEDYWDKKIFAPSCLIYYLGFGEKISNLQHHTLFFENDLDLHIADIYDHKRWPQNPLFYVCCPSKTDPTVAPDGHENIFLLMPLATGINDNEATREKYFAMLIARLEKHTGTTGLISKIDFKKSYCVGNFMDDYNAYGGNAYGLANTLSQTAMLRPTIRNKKLPNLFYTGQLTVPGPGVPPAIISGKIASNEIQNLG